MGEDNNMHFSVKKFLQVVEESRALTREQKELLLERPEDFSESYRSTLCKALIRFDQRSLARERELRVKLEEEYRQLVRDLYAQEPDGKKRDSVLKKAREQINACFSVA